MRRLLIYNLLLDLFFGIPPLAKELYSRDEQRGEPLATAIYK